PRCARRSGNSSVGFRSIKAEVPWDPTAILRHSARVPRSDIERVEAAHALSELRQPRYASQGLAADRGFLRHPSPPCVPDLQFPLYHIRARAAARAGGHQAQRPPRAVRSRQAVALGADRAAQASGRARAHRPGRVQDRARAREPGESEVSSEAVGEMVMEALRALDDVAYVRFASVYRNFREAKDFETVLDELSEDGKPGAAVRK